MKKLILFLLILFLFVGCAPSEEEEVVTKPWPGPPEVDLDQPAEVPREALYIETAQLSDEEEQLLSLVDNMNAYALFDFTTEAKDHILTFRTYKLENGSWQMTAGEAERDRPIRVPRGDSGGKHRMALMVGDLSCGLFVHIQQEGKNATSGTRYLYEDLSEIGDHGYMPYTLPARTEILYNQEIPLVLQLIPKEVSISIDDVNAIFEHFSDPSAFAASAENFEHIYALTVTFTLYE